ncbi:hypothetical protein J6590_072678 [Homalodisca vitripennis]|nr:hypothetical protein J6590_072678 [Homalodisca vitripennis]
MRFDSEITEGKLTLEGVMIKKPSSESEHFGDAHCRLGKETCPNSPQPGIVVKFVRRLDKEELLRKRSVKSKFFTRHMNLSMDQPIRRRLLAAARQVKKERASSISGFDVENVFSGRKSWRQCFR